MIISREQSLLLLVDVQQKLTPFVHESEAMLARIQWLLGVAKVLQVPVQYSEQYPQGLGETVDSLKGYLDPKPHMTKLHFSCADDESCFTTISSLGRNQVIIMGIEAHVCVMQTALGLAARGKQVFVVADATSSRNPQDMHLALSRMRHSSVEIVSREMVVFEWLQQSGTDEFRTISQNYLKHSIELI